MDHCSKLCAKLLDLLLLNLWEMFVFTKWLLMHNQKMDYWQTYRFSQCEHSLHLDCEGRKKKQVSVSACTVGRDLKDHSPHLVSGSSLLLSHCSKVLLKFINKTKRRYSIVWGLEGVTQDFVSSLKLSPKDGGTNSANKAEKWSWTWFLCFFKRSTDVL